MKYAYEDMSPTQFENLIVAICQPLLGAGVQGFAEGRDGGRDARFVGTAERYPSTAAPWNGTVIIQAKHTNGLNKKFTDSDFYSPDSNSTVVAEEVPRIASLVRHKELDFYMLFSNRRLTGQGEADIRSHIADECGIAKDHIALLGVEQIEAWLKLFPDAAGRAGIDPRDYPLIVGPEEMAEVVEAFAKQLPVVAFDTRPVDRVAYDKKNQINKMSAEYASMLRKRFLKESQQIQDFLADPVNDRLLQLYVSAVDEFQAKIIAKRREYDTFDEIMNYLYDLLLARDSTLRANRRLTRALLFYMYWNCDIGQDKGD